MCPNCRAFITVHDKVCPYCEMKLGPPLARQRAPGQIMGGLIPHAQFTTVLILLINLGMYTATALYSMKAGRGGFYELDTQTLALFGAKFGPFIYEGQWWRLITAGFLHGGLWHILFNSWVLFDVGAQVEEVFGTPRYLVIYFVTTVCGYLASLWWAPNVPSIGASAGIMGLIGAMVAFGTRSHGAYGSAIRNLYMKYIVYILIFGLILTSVDNAAHIGGVISGFGVAYVTGTPGRSQAMERVWRGVAILCGALTAYAFLQMFQFLIAYTKMR